MGGIAEIDLDEDLQVLNQILIPIGFRRELWFDLLDHHVVGSPI